MKAVVSQRLAGDNIWKPQWNQYSLSRNGVSHNHRNKNEFVLSFIILTSTSMPKIGIKTTDKSVGEQDSKVNCYTHDVTTKLMEKCSSSVVLCCKNINCRWRKTQARHGSRGFKMRTSTSLGEWQGSVPSKGTTNSDVFSAATVRPYSFAAWTYRWERVRERTIEPTLLSNPWIGGRDIWVMKVTFLFMKAEHQRSNARVQADFKVVCLLD